MTNEEFEQKILRWSELRKRTGTPSLKSPTWVIMQMMKMNPDCPDTEGSDGLTEKQAQVVTASKDDEVMACVMDEVYCSPYLPDTAKTIIRLYYFTKLSPKKIEERLKLGRWTFKFHHQHAITIFRGIYESKVD